MRRCVSLFLANMSSVTVACQVHGGVSNGIIWDHAVGKTEFIAQLCRVQLPQCHDLCPFQNRYEQARKRVISIPW